MRRLIRGFGLLAIIALAAGGIVRNLAGSGARRPLASLMHRSKVDNAGHTRGVVQVDLMRQIIALREHVSPQETGSGEKEASPIPSQEHPLLGRPAPRFSLLDSRGEACGLDDQLARGPVVIVFHLGFTCIACVTHLVDLDVARFRFRERGTRVLAISGDAPEFSRERMRKFGELQIPLLSDTHHAVSVAYGAGKPLAGSDDVEALHGTFIVDASGLVRWAHVGDRPFSNVDAILAELDRGTISVTKTAHPKNSQSPGIGLRRGR